MRTSLLLLSAMLAALYVGGSDRAKAQDAAPPVLATQPLVTNPTIDPAALEALQRMGAYLRTLSSFEVQSDFTTDEVDAETGQKLQFSGTTQYRVRRPNAFVIDFRTDRRQRQFIYDGRTLTVFAPRMGYYAQVPAPATIIEVLNLAEQHYHINLPLTDLFYWGTPEANTSALLSAIYVGYANIDGAHCDQWAFHQEDVDWQIWIERGDRALPHKIVITTRDGTAFPEFSASLTWNLTPTFNNATFTFTPTVEAHRIQIASASE